MCPDSVQTETNGNIFYQTFISLEGDPIETLTCKVIRNFSLKGLVNRAFHEFNKNAVIAMKLIKRESRI